MIKIRIKKIKKELKKYILLGSMPILPFLITGCSKEYSDAEEITYAPGEHMLLEVDRNTTIIGKNGIYELTAPKGYKVIEYDYDKNGIFNYDDYVYVNTETIITKDANEFGTPVNSETETDKIDNIYKPGEHNLVDIDRSLTIFGKFSGKKDLISKPGYEIVDYDYDMEEDSGFEFENITYTNNVEVETNNSKKFGTPTTEIEEEQNDYYMPREHYIVYINRKINLLWGKEEEKTINAPVGYEIVDYDYDKLEESEYETILYRNTVKVTKVENDFGTPLEETKENDKVLVDIDRNLNMFIGFNKLQEIPKKDGYNLVDYDYDKTEDFEFETYVYKKKR